MAKLIQCLQCGHNIGRKAIHCPHCGSPNKYAGGWLIAIAWAGILVVGGWYAVTYLLP